MSRCAPNGPAASEHLGGCAQGPNGRMTAPMTTTRKIGIAVAALVALFVAFNVYYFLPRAKKVMITQTEVQRRDATSSSKGTGQTRDMLLIYASDYESKKPIVFRNEDNIFYFKVDSSDLAAHAARLATDDPDGAVLVSYYGVRMALFSVYPNALSLKEVPADYTHVPWVSVVVLVLVLALFIWGGVKIRKVFRSAKEKITKRPAAS